MTTIQPHAATRVTDPVVLGSPEYQALLAQIAEGAQQRESDRESPYETIELIRRSGLQIIRLPEALGGQGASIQEVFRTVIDLAAADSNVAHILRAHFWFVELRLQGVPSPANDRWLAELAAGAIFGNATSELGDKPVGTHAWQTTLTPNVAGAGHVLDGTKYYSTGTIYSDYVAVLASTPDGGQASVVVPTDRDGVTVSDDWDGFGQSLTGTGTTVLDQVAVADDEVFFIPPYGAYDAPPTYQTPALQLYLAALAAGITRNVRDDATALLHRRQRSFTHAPGEESIPAKDPQLLQVVGELAVDAYAAEQIVLGAALAIDAAADSVVDGLPGAGAATQAGLASAQAQLAVETIALRAATRLFDVGGASATKRTANLDRHWRNVRTLTTHNPSIYKARAIGDHFVNGAALPSNGFF